MSRGMGLRIGYLVQQFPPEVGAGPARVAEMALRWQAAGAHVTVITGMPNRPQGRIRADYRGKLFVDETWQGIRVLRSWLYASPRGGFARTVLNNASFMTTGALHGIARAQGLDVLIASSPPFLPHLAGAVMSAVGRTPLVLEIRDLWPDYIVGMGVVRGRRAAEALFALERWLLRRATRAVVVTESFKARVAAKGMPADCIDVIPNGVDVEQYFAVSEPPPLPELRREPDEFVVGYLGNFGAGQGLAAVVEAAALLTAEHPGMKFVLAGDGPERERIVARARELEVSRLAIHPPIPKHETRAFYNACDACLVPLAAFPILQETIPSKMFEVMACARPLVASLGGEGARIVEASASGVVTAPGDARGIADAILAVKAMTPAERSALGTRGRAFVARSYNRDALAARYLEIISEVVEAARSRGTRTTTAAAKAPRASGALGGRS